MCYDPDAPAKLFGWATYGTPQSYSGGLFLSEDHCGQGQTAHIRVKQENA